MACLTGCGSSERNSDQAENIASGDTSTASVASGGVSSSSSASGGGQSSSVGGTSTGSSTASGSGGTAASSSGGAASSGDATSSGGATSSVGGAGPATNTTTPSGSGGSSSAGAGGSTVIEPPPACEDELPELESYCDPEAMASCSVGDFWCSCQCECASCQGLDPCPCTGPCLWRCPFYGYEDSVQLASASLAVDCSNPDAPTLDAAVDVEYLANASGPPLSVEVLGFYLELEADDLNGRSCSLDRAPSNSSLGPIDPGTSLEATHELSDGVCPSVSGLDNACAYCDGTARIALTVQYSAGGLTSQAASRFLGEQPQGTGVPIVCTQ